MDDYEMNDNEKELEKFDKTKKRITLTFTILIIAMLVIPLYIIFMPTLNTSFLNKIFNNEKIVADKEYLYDRGASYIIEKYHDLNTRKEQKDYQVFIDYEPFGITNNKEYYYVYMWVLSESYFVKNDNQLFQGRSNSSLYKITFKDDTVVDYEMPDNGKSYEDTESYVMTKDYDFPESLRSMCPNDKIYNKIMDYEVNLSNEDIVKEVYSYLTDFTIHHEVLDTEPTTRREEQVPFPNCKASGGSGYESC